jgi:hypothetical protein
MCENCDEEAPMLGDSGYMGYPSLDDKVPDIDVATFGSIYRTLAAVHVITGEVATFYKFLERHKGHRIVTETEYGSPFEDDEEDMDEEDELFDEDGFDDEDDDGLEDELEDEDMEEDSYEEQEKTAEDYVRAKYQATCTKCNASFQTKNDDDFVPFDRVVITAKDMKAYQRRVVDVMDESSYHAEPLWDGDLEDLATFFKKHMKHEVVVELVPEEA